MKKRTIFTIFLVLIGLNLLAQGTISIESTVDKSTIHIGDRVTYTLTVKHSADVAVDLPATGINLGQFEIQDYQVLEPQKKDGLLVEEVTYQISIYEVGDFVIPPVPVQYTLPDSQTFALQSEEIAIHVVSLKPSEMADIRDVKAPLTVPPDYTFYYFLGGVLSLLLLVVLAIYIYLKKFKKEDIPFFAPPPPRPAHEVAYEALQALDKEKLLESGEVKLYYIKISEIIRTYLSRRYEIDVLEMTTFELLLNLREVVDIEEENVELIQDFLNKCDLVKFAKYIPTEDDTQSIMPLATKIVDNTRRLFIAPPVMSPVNECAPQPEPTAQEKEVAV